MGAWRHYHINWLWCGGIDTKQLYAGNSATNALLRAICGRTYDPVFGSLSASY